MTTSFQRCFVIQGLGLSTINLTTTFEVYNCTPTKITKAIQNTDN